MRARDAMWIGALLTLSCAPSLSETPGHYTCLYDAGACPPGYTCRFDGVCAEGVETRALPGRTPCQQDDEAEICASEVCATGVDGGFRAGYCSLECDAAVEDACALMDGAICVDGECLLTCRMTPDCPPGTQCLLPTLPPSRPSPREPICMGLMNPNVRGVASCTGTGPGMGCEPPGVCLKADANAAHGVCSMRCVEDAHCPDDGLCVEVLEGHRQCLRACDPATAAPCTGELACASLTIEGAPTDVCVPSGWEGATPLAGTPPIAMPPPPGT